MNGFTDLVDLAAARLGGKVLKANDEFFAPKENLVKASEAIFIPEKFTSRGKWMDGWESRRKRGPGHDWCLLRLGLRGTIRGVNVDTAHFTGNYPEHFSLEACDLPGKPTVAKLLSTKTLWVQLAPKSRLRGGSENLFSINSRTPATHVRFHIYPDGGVARLRVHGQVLPDWRRLIKGKGPVDLASIENGGLVLSSSDQHFGHRMNLIMPGRGKNMGDGWETRRRRGPGHDWAVIRLGRAGRVGKIEVDTNHFKGNFPDSCVIEGRVSSGPWKLLLPRVKLKAHKRHFFSREIAKIGSVEYVRLAIYPDGGVSRLRIYGKPSAT